MIRKLMLVAIATSMFIAAPVLLATPEAVGTSRAIHTAVQPAPTYPAWMFEPAYPEPDWALLEQCWNGRDNSPGVPPPGCSGRYPLSLPCHWTVGYPDREWAEEACGPVDGWGPDFGFGWYGHWDPHPGRDWVAQLRAGGQP